MSKHSFTKEDMKRIAMAAISFSIAIFFAFILIKLGVIFKFLGNIVDAMSPIILGLVMAFLLNPVMNMWKSIFEWCIGLIKALKKETVKKLANTLGVIFTLITFIAIIAALIAIVVPALKDSILKLYDNIPTYIENVSKWAENLLKNNPEIEDMVISYLDGFQTSITGIIKDKLLPNIDTVISVVSTGIVGGISFVIDFFVALVAAVYVLGTKNHMAGQCKKLIYSLFDKDKGNKVIDGFSYMYSVFGGFINGKIIDSIIIGLICAIFCNLVDMPYAALVSVIVGVTNVVPYFGPFIGAIPSAILILVDDPKMAVVFVIFAIILQQIDGNIIGPMILGDSTGLTGFWVLFAIIVGGNLFGFMGMLLGVPVFACIYTLITILLRGKLKERGMNDDTQFYSDLYRFDDDGNPITEHPVVRKKPKEFKNKKVNEFAERSFENLQHLILHEDDKGSSKKETVSNSSGNDKNAEGLIRQSENVKPDGELHSGIGDSRQNQKKLDSNRQNQKKIENKKNDQRRVDNKRQDQKKLDNERQDQKRIEEDDIKKIDKKD